LPNLEVETQSDVRTQWIRSGPALAGAGSNARPGRGVPLSSGVWRHRVRSNVLRPFWWKRFSNYCIRIPKQTANHWS